MSLKTAPPSGPKKRHARYRVSLWGNAKTPKNGQRIFRRHPHDNAPEVLCWPSLNLRANLGGIVQRQWSSVRCCSDRPRQQKIFIVYEGDDDTTEYEAYIAAHGPGSAVVLRMVYAVPLAQESPT